VTTRPDAELIARSARRPSAFEVVFERHYAAVYRRLRGEVGPDRAEELANETFARAFTSRRAYDPAESDVRAWLLAIASEVQADSGIPHRPAEPVPADDDAERTAHYRGWTMLRKQIRSERRVLRYLWPLVPLAAAIAVIVVLLVR
jgi:hypothetical protein